MKKFRVAQLGNLDCYRIEVYWEPTWFNRGRWEAYSYSEYTSREYACHVCAGWNESERRAEAKKQQKWHGILCGEGGGST
jgi:hypothetical protein